MVLRREGPSHIIKDKRGPDDPELLESLEDALSYASAEDLVQVADDLAARRERFVELSYRLAEGDSNWALDDLTWLARSVTHSRKKAAQLYDFLTSGAADIHFPDLLDPRHPAPVRIAAFVSRLNGAADKRLLLELATGLLHYTDPRSNWLWTRWMWDAGTQTGILPLLAGSVHNLVADDIATGYVNVGSVMAMAMRFAEGTELLTPELMEDPRRADYANDVFLACAYSIYLYGITSWRLSREYNRLLPTLPNLMRKLLGLPKVA
ncbi:MAG: hypothetical protein GXP42_05550 [Chloroflexi bacterium]|nr:hypothetical protein [Chloroflexota bacterium]